MAIQQFYRVNGKIRAREVRAIGPDGKQLGVMSLNEALRRAQQLGMDLVEIAPNAQPPVCRITELGKFRYEQARREREARRHQHATKVKEQKFHANISEHDYQVKLRHIREFLSEGIRVKISLFFRGREMAHQEIGKAVVHRLIADCADLGHAEMEPRLVGRGIHTMLTPKPASKKSPKPPTSAAPAPAPAPSPPSDGSAQTSPAAGFVNSPKIVVTNKP